MGGFGRILVALVTAVVTGAGYLLQLENWRLENYHMYDGAISKIDEVLVDGYAKPGLYLESVGRLTDNLIVFLGEGCQDLVVGEELASLKVKAPGLAAGSGRSFPAAVCPLTGVQRSLLLGRLQNMQCNQAFELLQDERSLSETGAFRREVADGLRLARERYRTAEHFGCPLPTGQMQEEPAPEDVYAPAVVRARKLDRGSNAFEGAANGFKTRCASGDACRLFTQLASTTADRDARARMRAFQDNLSTSLVSELERSEPGTGRALDVLGPEIIRTSLTNPNLRYLKAEDREAAAALLTMINLRMTNDCELSLTDLSGVYGNNPKVRARTFELWVDDDYLDRCAGEWASRASAG